MSISSRKHLFGHRGARGVAPENTIASFARALADGATALEMDVHRTSDGVVVVFHDDTLLRMAGDPRPIAELTAAEVARIDVGQGFVADDGSRPFAKRGLSPPKLADVLRAFPGVPINIDLKTTDPRLREDTVAVIDDAGAVDRVVLASFHDEVVDAVIDSGCRCRVALARNAVRAARLLPLPLARRYLHKHLERGGSRLQIPPRASGISLDSEGFIQKAHTLGLAVDYWVVNDLEQAKQLLARGADGLITDFPGRLAGLFPSAMAG